MDNKHFEFKYRLWKYIKDDGNHILGFRGVDEKEYILIMNAENYDQQDIDLGMDSHYLELMDQGCSCYNAIQYLIIQGNLLMFIIQPEKVQRLDLEAISIKIQERNSLIEIVKVCREFMKLKIIHI